MPPKGKKKKFVKVVSTNKQIESVGNNLLNELVSEDQFKDALNRSRLDTSQYEDGDDEQNQSVDSNGMLTTLLAKKFQKKKNNLLNMSARSDLRDSHLEEDQSNISIHDDQNDGKAVILTELDTSGLLEKTKGNLSNKHQDGNRTLPLDAMSREEIKESNYHTDRAQIKPLDEEDEFDENYFIVSQKLNQYLENEQMAIEDLLSRFANNLEKKYSEQIIVLEELSEMIRSHEPGLMEFEEKLNSEDREVFKSETARFKEVRREVKEGLSAQIKEIIVKMQKRKQEALKKVLDQAYKTYNSVLLNLAFQNIKERAKLVQQQRDEEDRKKQEEEKKRVEKEKEEKEKKKAKEEEEKKAREKAEQEKKLLEQKALLEEQKNEDGIIKQIEQLVDDEKNDAGLFSERNEHLKTLNGEEEEENGSNGETFRSNFTQDVAREGEDQDKNGHQVSKGQNNQKKEEDSSYNMEAMMDKQIKEKKQRKRLETVKEVYEEDLQSEARHNSEFNQDLFKQQTQEALRDDPNDRNKDQRNKEGSSVLPIVVVGVGVLAAAAFASYKFLMLK